MRFTLRLLVALYAAWLTLFGAACVRALRTERVTPTSTPWCVWIRFDKGDASKHCFETRERCTWAEAGGRTYGRLGFVADVDECAYEEGE